MTGTRKYCFLTFLTVLALLLTACGSASETTIATAVAMTVQAQNTLQAQFTPTLQPPTYTPTLLASLTPISTKVPPTAPPPNSGNIKSCYSATYVADVSYPDGTIVSPGTSFIKRWSVTNSGSCTWNSTYKFVFIDGDIMGGAYVYPFPAVAAPGQTVEIPIQLYAPTDNGDYTGNWMIQAPDKTLFGVGQYSQPLTVKIVVGSGTPSNSKTQTVYGVTNVTYETDVSLIRTCKPANTFYHYIAYITSSGPVKVTYEWDQSDGHNYHNRKIEFDSATTLAVSNDWAQGISSSTNSRWVQLIVTSPTYQEWPRFTLPILCSQIP